jgi:hypothetical protein
VKIFGRRRKKKVQLGNTDHSGDHLLASGTPLLLHKTSGQNEANANVPRVWSTDTFGLCGMSALRQKSRENAIGHQYHFNICGCLRSNEERQKELCVSNHSPNSSGVLICRQKNRLQLHQ